jgi:crotonobetainyl-CoA:carnitine CoA-transferase CaiB-like acyl-CoA transferase
MNAVRLSETPVELRLRAPTIGEHTDQIMAELGFTSEETAAFHEARVI